MKIFIWNPKKDFSLRRQQNIVGKRNCQLPTKSTENTPLVSFSGVRAQFFKKEILPEDSTERTAIGITP